MDDCHVEPCVFCGKGVMLTYYSRNELIFCDKKCESQYIAEIHNRRDVNLQLQTYED